MRQAVPCCSPSALRGNGRRSCSPPDSRVTVLAKCPASGVCLRRQSHRERGRGNARQAPGKILPGVANCKVHAVEQRHLHQPEADRQEGERVKKGDVLADGPRLRRASSRSARTCSWPSCQWVRYNFETPSCSATGWCARTSSPRFNPGVRGGARDTKSARKRSPATSERGRGSLAQPRSRRRHPRRRRSAAGDILVGKITPRARRNWLPRSGSCAPSSAKKGRRCAGHPR